MKTRKIVILTILFILIGSIFAGTISALDRNAPAAKPALENVRAYAAPTTSDGATLVVDGGNLLAGSVNNWAPVETPSGVVGAPELEDVASLVGRDLDCRQTRGNCLVRRPAKQRQRRPVHLGRLVRVVGILEQLAKTVG